MHGRNSASSGQVEPAYVDRHVYILRANFDRLNAADHLHFDLGVFFGEIEKPSWRVKIACAAAPGVYP